MRAFGTYIATLAGKTVVVMLSLSSTDFLLDSSKNFASRFIPRVANSSLSCDTTSSMESSEEERLENLNQ